LLNTDFDVLAFEPFNDNRFRVRRLDRPCVHDLSPFS
jgi:hypothetical protein